MSRRLGRTPFKSRGDYEDVCCGLSALIKLMELASWPDSSAPEKENKKSVFREELGVPFRSQPRESMSHQ